MADPKDKTYTAEDVVEGGDHDPSVGCSLGSSFIQTINMISRIQPLDGYDVTHALAHVMAYVLVQSDFDLAPAEIEAGGKMLTDEDRLKILVGDVLLLAAQTRSQPAWAEAIAQAKQVQEDHKAEGSSVEPLLKMQGKPPTTMAPDNGKVH